MGDGLNVHAALSRDDEGDAAVLTVDQQGAVELPVDVGAVLDIEAVDLFAGLARLGGNQGVAQHFASVGHGFLDRFGQTDAALGVSAQFLELALAPATGVDLGLHDIERTGQRPGGSLGLVRRSDGHARRNRRAKALQNLLGLILVNIHGNRRVR